MAQLQISGDVLAWYAAIVSTTSVAISAFHAWHDRPRLYASVQQDIVIVNHPSISSDEKHIRVSIYNRGRRALTLSQVALHDAKAKKVMIIFDRFNQAPQETSETKSANFTTKQDGINFDNIDKILLTDSTGRSWQARFKLNDDLKLKRQRINLK